MRWTVWTRVLACLCFGQVCIGHGAVASLGCAYGTVSLARPATQTIHVSTADGWDIALHHFPPPDNAVARHFPLIICHGVFSNRHNWHLTDRLSFPLYAANQGFDTWVLELRGSGDANKPGLFDARAYTYNFDDYVVHDLPAALDFVRTRTGHPQVHWVGHSMGGMALYAYLQRFGEELVRSATVVASPPYFSDHNPHLNRAVAMLPLATWLLDELPAGPLVKMASPFAHLPLLPHEYLVWNLDNIASDTAHLAAANAIDNLSANVVRQLVAHADTDTDAPRLASADGSIDYTAGLANITVPIFFVAGAADQLAPPAAIMAAYRSVASTDKRIEILAAANGYRHDYGHVDLVLGESAPDEVYPLLLAWLVQHDG